MKKKANNNLKLQDLKENNHYNVETNSIILNKINAIDINNELKDNIELSKKFTKSYFKKFTKSYFKKL